MATRKIALLLFLANLLLIWPVFQINLSDINAFDETAYINSGYELVERGEWPLFAHSPLCSVFYALLYLPFRSAPFWLVHVCSVGRVLLFALLWWAAYLVAEAVDVHLDGEQPRLRLLPLVVGGLLLVMPLAVEMIRFPSDPLFAGLAALSLWQLLRYLKQRQVKNLAWASLCMGLAALARNDGLLAFGVLAVLAVLLIVPPAWKAHALRSLWRAAAALLLPFALLVGGYLVFSFLLTGNWEMGTLERTYLNFEAGQQVVYQGEGEISIVIESRLEAQRLFGSGEENGYSVLRAIQRNPSAYFERLRASVTALPARLLSAYGIRFAAVLFLLMGGGLLELLRGKQVGLLVLLALWPAPLASGLLITLFRTGHLQFPYYVVFTLAGIGLLALLRALLSLRDLRKGWLKSPEARLVLAWLLILLATGLAGWFGNKLAVFYNVLIVLAALLAAWLALPPAIAGKNHPAGAEISTSRLGVALLVLLAAGLVLHGDYPSPKQRVLGVDGREQAVLYMAENLPRDTLVAAAAPATVLSAHMRFANLTSTDVPVGRSSDGFVDWLRSQNVEAVYVDQILSGGNPALWVLLEAEIGDGLERAFYADEGDVQVLLVK